tara:strand:- start:12653 stop:13147 length:495 start_codon:yes stop_codon:yes gene_type:complete
MLTISIRYFIGYVALSSLVLISGCVQPDQSYEAVEIDFLNVRTLEEGDWIEIDGIRFNHVKAFEEVNEQLLTLPASRITKGAEARNTDFTEPFPSLNIGYLLTSYLHNINKKEHLKVEHDHTYTILNPDLVYAVGKLQFMRSDSSKVQIKTSPDYPVQIRAIQL